MSFIFFSSTQISNNKNNFPEKITNIFNISNNIKELVKAEDGLFLNNNLSTFLKRYEELSKTDDCVQVLSSDVAVPYFLKNPACTQFFMPVFILNGITEDKFINQLDKSSPNIILFKSPNIILLETLNMPNALKHIEEKYSFYENYNGYIFYKKN